MAPSGTWSVSSTNTAPALARVSTMAVVNDLVAHVDGAPCFSSARSTVSDCAIDAGAISAGSQQNSLAATVRPVGGARHSMLIVETSFKVRWPQSSQATPYSGTMPTAPYGIRLLIGAAVTALEETKRLPQTILISG